MPTMRTSEVRKTPVYGFKLELVVAVFCLLVGSSAWGQVSIKLPGTGEPAPNRSAAGNSVDSESGSASPLIQESARAPLPHLYWHFLLYQNHLDREAAAREQQGKNGNFLRTHLQKEIGFTDAQFGIVRKAGLRLETDLSDINSKAKAVIEQDRQWRQLHGGKSAGIPPGHAQIQQLRKEHEAVIQSEIADLNKALGESSAVQLRQFIDVQWAPHVTVHRLHARPHDPKNNPVVPMHMEARP